jgi:hypothetical protein
MSESERRYDTAIAVVLPSPTCISSWSFDRVSSLREAREVVVVVVERGSKEVTWQWTPPKIESSWLNSGVRVGNGSGHGWRGFIHSWVRCGFEGRVCVWASTRK